MNSTTVQFVATHVVAPLAIIGVALAARSSIKAEVKRATGTNHS